MMLAGVTVAHHAYPQQKPVTTRPAPSPAPKAGPRSLADVQEFVQGMAKGLITESEAIDKIRERGLNFIATPENLARLRAAGATPALLEAIRKLAPEPPKPTTTLAAACVPEECVIKINGSIAGTTTAGRFERAGLDIGQIEVTFEKEGYLTQQKTVQLSAAPSAISVEMEPNPATRQENGRKLFLLARHALGVESNFKPLEVLAGGGAITSYSGGRQTDWNFDFATAMPDLIEMKAESAAGSIIYQCKGERCLERKKKGRLGFIGGGKQIKSPTLEELETNLRAFAQYNLADIMRTLASPSAQFDALTASSAPKADQDLRIEAADATYQVAIGPDLLPSSIEYQSKSGLGSGIKVLFADFTKIGDAQYPRHTTIRLPNSAQSGIEVRLDHLTQDSELHESDFAK